jgi:hypothetical protein
MTLVRLVHGGDAAAREQAIASEIPAGLKVAVLLEGLSATDVLPATDAITVIRIAPGCPCCTGNLTMRVTLNRLLREPPAILFLSLANSSHLGSVKSFLQEEQYCGRLEPGLDLECGRISEIRA